MKPNALVQRLAQQFLERIDEEATKFLRLVEEDLPALLHEESPAEPARRRRSLLAQARRLRVSPHTLRRAIERGKLTAIQTGTRRRDLYDDEADAWLASNRCETPAERAARRIREGR